VTTDSTPEDEPGLEQEARITGTSVPSVCAVVLSWNGREDTLSCLESLLAQDYPRLEILLIDNASQDDTVTAVRQRFPDLEFLVNESNLLYAGGMNVGLARARDGRFDYVLLLNNDIVLQQDMISELVRLAEMDGRIAAVGPKIYYHAQPQRLWFAGGVLSLWRGWPSHRGLRREDRGQYDEATEVDYLTGCAMLMRTARVDDVGFLDPSFAMYAEDADWCFRARARGYRLMFAPRARMWHKVSASAGARSLFKLRRRFRSQMQFLRRHARWYHWLTIPLFTIAEAARVALAWLGRRL
jgi:GT2 family glycosyltransferase